MIPLISFILGVIYGVLHPGREDRLHILKKSVFVSVMLCLILGISTAVFLPDILAMAVFILAIPFILGTMLGDLIESLLK